MIPVRLDRYSPTFHPFKGQSRADMFEILLSPKRKITWNVSYPKRSDPGSQKSPSRPKPAKIPRISSGLGRREFSCSRVEYHVVASAQSWSILTRGRIGLPCAAHHSRTRSSDRKKSMFFQVKTISSHHFAAGTRQWKSQSEGSGPSIVTVRRKGSPDCAQRE